ncbi:MAG TPA: Dabb family protein [Bacteroidales bacterium]|nr:Dabb family protein [Bacteroidales bacterium]HPT02910.1 Dabb family protein [Bacteroidales bacterium]
MIRHIVLFKLRDFESEIRKQEIRLKIKNRIEELPGKIDLIRRCEVGVDIRKLEMSYDIVLIMDFDNLNDLNTYTDHPAHQEFIRFNKEFSAAKVCIDCEI